LAEIAVSKRASADLKRIWRFIALDNRNAGTKLLLRIDQRIAQLADFPRLAARRTTSGRDAGCWSSWATVFCMIITLRLTSLRSLPLSNLIAISRGQCECD
jgi:plasmid stabilization system protein ParE